MKPVKFLLFSFALLFVCLSGSSQVRISGKVITKDLKPLSQVSVAVKGNTPNIGTITDTAGNFTITVPAQNKTPVLVFSYVGFLSKEVSVQGTNSITVTLEETGGQLDDVVVIGYSTVRRKDLTGSVSSINAEQIKDVPINSAEQALTGRLAGVQVTASEGALDADVKIVVRGGASITQDNSPLYVIDGIQVEDGLRSISPQDIENIDVLKDASATAIYGSRGANGVVLVTTKSGKVGSGTVSYNGLLGINTLPETLPVMSPYEFVVYQYERFKGTAADRRTFARRYNTQPTDGTFLDIPSYSDLQKYVNVEPVDWQREVMGKTGIMKTHNVSVSGGTKATRYNFGYTNNNQSGILLNTDYLRHLFNVKLDQTVNEKLNLGFTLRYTSTNANGASTSDPGNAQLNGLRNFVKYKPYLNDGESVDEFDEEYFDATNQGGGLGLMNPVAGTLAKYRMVNTAVTNFGGNINYVFNKALSIRSLAGLNFTRQEVLTFRDALRTIEFPRTTFQNGDDKTMNWSNVLTYTNSKSRNKFARKNRLSALLGQEIYISQNQDLYNSLRDYPKGITPDAALTQLTQGTVVPGFPNRDYAKSTLLSFFGRTNYSYEDKYLAAITLRADGSSKFAPANRWGYFPSGSLAWKVSSENFMEDVNFVSDVKLRLSYGASGNNRIQDYAFMTTYQAEALYGLNNSINSFGYQSTNFPNPSLKWETTIQTNFGLDFSFLNNRVQATADYYSNKTNDVITRVDISPTTGYASQLQNTADTWNRGLELQLSGDVVRTKKFTWNANFNISFNKNTVERLASGLTRQEMASGWVSLANYTDYLIEVGESVGNIYGYVSDGFHTVDDFDYDAATKRYTLKKGLPDPVLFSAAQPGSVKIKDISGNGVIGTEDKQIIGNAIPTFFGGLNQQFTYGNFDASVFLNFTVGNDLINANKLEFTNGYLHNNNLLKIMEGRWRTIDNEGNSIQSTSGSGTATIVTGEAPEILREANKNATLWQPIRSNPGYFTTDWAVEDGSFVRVNNITIGYTFNAALLRKIRIKRARIYATGNNLSVFTNYSGYDPEVNTRRSTGLTPGVDYSAYPRSRSVVFGLNLSL